MALKLRIRDHFDPSRIQVWKDRHGHMWNVTIPEEFAADPADALEGWDPAFSRDPSDYAAINEFGLSDWLTFEDAMEFLASVERTGRLVNPARSPIRRRTRA